MYINFFFFSSVGHRGPLYNWSNDSLRTDSGNESSKHACLFFLSARDVCISDAAACHMCLPFIKMLGEMLLRHKLINAPSNLYQNI